MTPSVQTRPKTGKIITGTGHTFVKHYCMVYMVLHTEKSAMDQILSCFLGPSIITTLHSV